MATTRRDGSILAVDLGTGSVKAAVVTPTGRLAATGQGTVTTRFGDDGAAEQDPEEVWRAVVAAGRQAVGGVGADVPPVVAVSVCSQYSSIVPVDAAGQPTVPMVTWMDQRARVDRLRRLANGERVAATPWQQLQWVRIHGIPPLDSGVDSLAHMRWVKYARPDAYERTAAFLEPVDYVGMRLTGRIGATPCSAFMLLTTDTRHPDHGQHHERLVAASNIDPDKLPPIVDPEQPLGRLLPDVAADLGLPDDVIVFPGVNDTQAGGIGSGTALGDRGGLSMGTTTVLITDVGFKRTDILNSLVTMPSPVPGRWLVMAEAGTGGQAVDHFLGHLVFGRDGFGDHSREDGIERLHRAIEGVPPGSGGVLFLPWLAGSMAPREDGRVRAGFLNLSLDTTREHLGRAVLEGVALNLRWVLEAVERFSKRPMQTVRMYGGGALSALWAQIVADATRHPVERLAEPQYVACLGAGILGLDRTGQARLEDTMDWATVAETHLPDASAARCYDEMYASLVAAFRRNRRIFHRLNDDPA